MSTFLNIVTQEYRADELRDRAERERRWLTSRRERRAGAAAPDAPLPAMAPAPLVPERRVLGREHTSPAC
jgi:hypothetical protein